MAVRPYQGVAEICRTVFRAGNCRRQTMILWDYGSERHKIYRFCVEFYVLFEESFKKGISSMDLYQIEV